MWELGRFNRVVPSFVVHFGCKEVSCFVVLELLSGLTLSLIDSILELSILCLHNNAQYKAWLALVRLEANNSLRKAFILCWHV